MNNYEKEAHELSEKLSENNLVLEAWVTGDYVHGADVNIVYNEKTLPMGLLSLISEYGDLHIEGIEDGNALLTVYI